MTYHLWHNGTDTGPYTREEIAKRHARGELVGVLWRRTGDTQFHPHTELGESLSQPTDPDEDTPDPSSPRSSSIDTALLERIEARQHTEPEPKGTSVWDVVLSAFGGCLCLLGTMAAVIGESVAGMMIGSGLTLIVVGTLLGIHAKLELIAHRLRR